MFRNYVQSAIRFLSKNKTFGIINIVGLAAGTVCCLYILLYVHDQYSYDQHHAGVQSIYRVTSTLSTKGDGQEAMATCSPPVAPAMKNEIAGVMQYTRVVPTIGVNQHLLRYKDKIFYETEGVFADSTFFDVFTWHFVQGHPAKALHEPYSIVLHKETADKLFGKEEAVGKRIGIDNSYGKHDFLVTGVIDDQLGRSHIQAKLFMSMNSGGIGDFVRSNNTWAGQNFTNSYVKLHPASTAADIESKLPALLQKYGQEQLKNLGMRKKLHLQPVTAIHTTPGYEAEMTKTISPSFLNVLLIIAVLIQFIACINFMNLSTANASKRAKDVGVRKVIGARKQDLVKQFLGESVLLAVVAVALAIPLLGLSLPFLNAVTRADIPFSIFTDYRTMLLLLGFALVTGVLAGSYPAFYLSSFAVTKVIKGNFTSHISAIGIRKALVVFQFVLSICLITGILVIYFQLQYMRNKDLGYEKDQRLIFSFHTQETKQLMNAFASNLQIVSEVEAVSKTNNYPSQFIFNDMRLFVQGGNAETANGAQFMITDEHFVKTSGIHLLAGRDFHSNDEGKVLINETFMKDLGLTPQNAIGTRLYSPHKRPEEPAFEIAGVVKDFNYNSLHEPVKSFMLAYGGPNVNMPHLIVAVNTDDYSAVLKKIEAVWHRVLPSTPFECHFLDEQVEQQYEEEITAGRIINAFAAMAILISCLGLFGLSAFTAEQRRKEIGIRKVLGANTFILTRLLSKDFIKLIAMAILIATPLSWWAANQWLQAFVYRIEVSWWIFCVAGMLALVIALATISVNAIKAALSNPVRNLRTE
jgi:putative ABC transport system permease protein